MKSRSSASALKIQPMLLTLKEYQTIPTKMTAAKHSDNSINMGVYENFFSIFKVQRKLQLLAKM